MDDFSKTQKKQYKTAGLPASVKKQAISEVYKCN